MRYLEEGRIAGADPDVFTDEPNIPEALFALDNVALQPHAAVTMVMRDTAGPPCRRVLSVRTAGFQRSDFDE